VRAQFILSEMRIGLRRNLTMTIAVVVTVAISLALLGAGLLIRQQVNLTKGYWYDKVEVSVYLCGDQSKSPNCGGAAVTPEQRAHLLTDLEAMKPLVKKVYYESQADAYKRFEEQFKDSPDLVQNVSPDALPEAYRVSLSQPEKFEVVASALRDRPGVEQVQDQKKLLAPFFKLLNALQYSALGIALFQLLVALLLISNTIRLSAFSRRRETGIMRLVGASSMYIQLPFLLEGVLAGLVGAALASGGMVLVKLVLVDRFIQPSAGFTAFIGWDAVIGTIPWLVLAGVLMAGSSSLFTLRRHLRV